MFKKPTNSIPVGILVFVSTSEQEMNRPVSEVKRYAARKATRSWKSAKRRRRTESLRKVSKKRPFSVSAECPRARELSRELSDNWIGQLSGATFLKTPSYGRWVFLRVLTSVRSEFCSIRPKAERASGAFAECPLVMSFFNCLLGVGWDDYGTLTVTSLEQSPESVSQTW